MNDMNPNNHTRIYSEAKRQEVLSRILHGPNSFIHALEKDDSIISLPARDGNKPTSAEENLELALAIDETIDMVYKLVGKENSIRRGLPYVSNDYEIFQVSQANREYTKISDIHAATFEIDSEVAADPVARRWSMASYAPSLVIVRYDAHTLPLIYPAPELVKIAETILNRKLEENYDLDSFETLIIELIDSINVLFEKEGIEPTDRRRYNLISLAVGIDWHILRSPEITNLINIEEKDFNILNPALIHLAATGIDDVIIKLCYAHWIFPENIEELSGLSALPLQTLYHIWGLEWELPQAS